MLVTAKGGSGGVRKALVAGRKTRFPTIPEYEPPRLEVGGAVTHDLVLVDCCIDSVDSCACHVRLIGVPVLIVLLPDLAIR